MRISLQWNIILIYLGSLCLVVCISSRKLQPLIFTLLQLEILNIVIWECVRLTCSRGIIVLFNSTQDTAWLIEKHQSIIIWGSLNLKRIFYQIFKPRVSWTILVKLGKCPECKIVLEDSDVEDIHFKGKVIRHIAYRCIHCGSIIGFSSHNRLS